MTYRLRYIITFVLVLSASGIRALSFHYMGHDKNVLIHYDDPKGSLHQMKMNLLARLIRSVSTELHKENINIVLFHDMTAWGIFDQYSTDEERHHEPAPELALGYEYVHKDHEIKNGPALCIYYNGDLDIDKQVEIAYYALTHVDEIKSKQKLINRIYAGFRDKKRYYAQFPDLDMRYSSNEVTRKVLSEIRLSLSFYIYPEIDYYYSNKEYHILKRDKPMNDTPKKFSFVPPAKGTELMALKDIIHIIRFTANDYIVFNAYDNFYHLDISKVKVSGPFKTLGWPGNIIESYVKNDELVMKIPYSEHYSRDITCTVKFNRKTQKVSSDELQISLLMASGMWPYIDPAYDYRRHYDH